MSRTIKLKQGMKNKSKLFRVVRRLINDVNNIIDLQAQSI